jgi:outer membrane protein TolC
VGPALSETVFDGGLRQAQVRQYVHAYNATVAAYRLAVLTAVQQVEDGLAGQRALTAQLEHERRAVASAEEYVKLEWVRYETGIDPYVDVVLAQNALLTARQSEVQVQTQQLLTSVQLIQALGGGWERSQLPSPEQVTADPPPVH